MYMNLIGGLIMVVLGYFIIAEQRMIYGGTSIALSRPEALFYGGFAFFAGVVCIIVFFFNITNSDCCPIPVKKVSVI